MVTKEEHHRPRGTAWLRLPGEGSTWVATRLLTGVAKFMSDATYLREKAQQCRELLKVAVLPEVIEQLQVWIGDFEDQAFQVEQRGRVR